MLDITSDMKNPIQYGGSRIKFGITWNNMNWIVKFPVKNTGSVFSEVIASKFIRNLGVSSHICLFGRYSGKIVAVCRDFTSKSEKLHEYGSMSSTLDTDQASHEYYLKDVRYILSKVDGILVSDIWERFQVMCIMDAILGNTDRHLGNWGLLESNRVFTLAPIYDNDASLFPRITDFSDITNIQFSKYKDAEWVLQRTEVFPNSKIMLSTRERSSYRDLLWCDDFDTRVNSKFSCVNMAEIMWNTCVSLNIPSNLRDFYSTIVYYRQQCLLRRQAFRWLGTYAEIRRHI